MTQPIDNLIQNISPEIIQDFFKKKISSFRPEKEALDYVLKDADMEQFSGLTKLGEAAYDDTNELLVFACHFNGELTARSSKKKQYTIAKNVLKEDFKDGAIFVFYDDEGQFRFSFIRRIYGDKERKYTNWKRYTYFISPNKANKTFRKQINSCSFDSLDAILKAFSIDAVTDDFYNEFKPKFDHIANSIVGDADSGVKKDFALLFVIRTIFIGFVQKRKWLGNSDEFVQNLWKEYSSHEENDDSFYKNWYEPLLFDALNTPPGSEVKYRNNNYSEETRLNLKMAPYLNGELFKRKQKVDTIGLYIPDKVVGEFFEFLFSYNFTIEENTLYDEELELNPEFLGIIFERLVNKEDGAVYTPRTEVDFMCRISLVKWLQKVSQADIKDIYHLFFVEMGAGEEYKDFQKYGDFSAAEIKELIHLLKNVTVCDPAAGSGAFPVGMMQVLNEIIENLQDRSNTPDELKEKDDFERKKAIIANSLYGVEVKQWAVWINQLRLWLSLFVEIPEERENEFKLSPMPLLPNLDFKIRYGDSLVQRIGEKLFPVHGHVQDLPSGVKTKITELKKAKINFFYNQGGHADGIRQKENEIFRAIIDEQMDAKNKEITRLKRPQAKQTSMFDDRNEPEQAKIVFDQERIDQLNSEIENLKAEKAAFIEDHPLIWNIEFAEVLYERKGFDIIIGNPPYVRQEDIADPHKQLSTKEYKNLLKETMRLEFPRHFTSKEKIDGKSDLYTFFYVKSLRLLNQNGIHTFICSNSWLDVGYGVWLQKFLLRRCHVHYIIDNHARRSFASADVNTIISVMDVPVSNLTKLNERHQYKFVAHKRPFEETLFTENLLEIEQQQTDVITNQNFRSYPISIEKLLEEGSEFDNEQDKQMKQGKFIGDKWGGKYLRAPDVFFTVLEKGKEYFVKLDDIAKVKRGITTGCNEFFYLTKEEADGWGIEEEYLKPAILKTAEIKTPDLQNEVSKGYFFYTKKDKKTLKNQRAIKYVENGEIQEIEIKQGHNKGEIIKGYHNIETVKNRKLWYSLGDRKTPPLLWMIAHNDRTVCFKNDRFLVGDNFFEIYSKTKENEVNIFNSLNSTYTTLLRELFGRSNFGGGVLKTQKPDLNRFLVFEGFKDVEFDVHHRPTKSIFQECGIDPESEILIEEQEPKPLPDRKALDDVVFDAIGLTEQERKDVYRSVCRLVWNRVSKAKSTQGK